MPILNHSSCNPALQPIRGAEMPVEDDLIAIFLKHVESSPDHMAIMTSDTSLTYQQLYVDVLCWKALFSQQLHDRVVVCLERTPRVFSVLLALQWLEIAYIPVDPSLPIERVRRIIEDSQAQAILYDTPHYSNDYSTLPCLQLNLASIERPEFHIEEATYTYAPNQDRLAYIIYTSGSTGIPKGVAISRRALNNYLSAMSHHFLNEDHAFLLAITTLAFDMAELELYLPLWQQKTIYFANQDEHKDPILISQLLKIHPITHLQATPAMWKMLDDVGLDTHSTLVAFTGGEPLTPSLAEGLLVKVAELWNMYGPTEATISCSIKQIKPNEPITIGRPIQNMEMRVLDSSHHILPPNVKGELFIGGIGLAEGYVNDEALTQSRFIPCPDAIGGRLYRVGDVACSTPEGEFIMFGRTDNQIKLHGYRIELEDIESNIQTISGIRECAVIVFEEQLIAYLCMTDATLFSETMFINQLSVELPDYMLPSRVITLDKLPLTSNGKVDRKALPRPKKSLTMKENDPSELTLTQSTLLTIWCTELNLPFISVNDNFFELGGHSLIAARIMAKTLQQIGKKIEPKAFYQAPTIAELATLIDQTPSIEQLDSKKKKDVRMSSHKLPLNDFQFMLWLSMLFEEPQLKNISVVDRRRIEGPLNKNALDSALQCVCESQDIFSYTINRFYPSQKHQKRPSVQWIETSLLNCDERATESFLNASLDELYYNTPWLTSPAMLIAKLFYLKNGQIELQIGMSHLIADHASLEIFFQALSEAYLIGTSAKPLDAAQSEPRPSVYHPIMSYAAHENDLLSHYGETDSLFWKQYLADTGFFYFPEKHIIRNFETKYPSSSSYIEIDEAILTKLRKFCSKNHVNLSDVLSAALGMSLVTCSENKASQHHKLFINTVKSTRDDPHYDHIIGCFLRINPIKLDLNQPNMTLTHLAKQAQLSSLETTEHQRASNLVKLASIGQLPCSKKQIKRLLTSIALTLCAKLFKRPRISPSVLNACKILSSVERDQGFVVNLNIINNFFSNTPISDKNLLGVPCQTVPMHSYQVSQVKYVLDVCCMRDSNNNTPFVVISGNLTPAFRQLIGKTLIRILQQEFSEECMETSI